MTVEKIVEALDDRIRQMREGHYRSPGRTPIAYINGFEDAAGMVSDLLIQGGARVDR